MMSVEHCLEKLEFDKVKQRVIRYATSEPGRELLQVLTISFALEEIQDELTRVSEMKRLLELEEELPLAGICPVAGLVHKAAVEGSFLLGRDLRQIGSTLAAARILKSFMTRRRELYPLVWQIAEPLYVDKVLEYNIDQAIDESGAVKASASRELQSIRRALADKYEYLRKRLEGILKNASELGLSQEDIITTREGRMVIPVKAEHKNRVHGFVHSASASGATVFIEPTETLELNNEIRTLQFQEQREVERILRELTTQVGQVRDALLSMVVILARLDSLHAKAKYSIEILGAQPAVVPDGAMKLLTARHPLLLVTHGYAATVPLDVELGREFRTLVISGPNAGGKSVAMKCVGLLVLMTQAGLHIPASDQSTVRVFKKIFVDIGDEQSIENDLSTFSSHLANLKEIDEKADATSLVLIDEIGSGTDPAEGGAIAAALLESLTRRGGITLATTHQGVLKVFAHETDGVENGAMEFDQETLAPTYRFKSGVPGSSYALEMAARLGFAESVLKRSRELLGQQQTKLEGLIAELELHTQQYRRDLSSMVMEKSRLDELVRQYESKIASQGRELKEMKRRAIDEAQQILERANTLIERSIREIREQQADKRTVKEARAQVAELKKEIGVQYDALVPIVEAEGPGRFEIGDTVKLQEGTDAGEIETLLPDGNTAIVVFGNIRMKVRLSDLSPAGRRTTPSRQTIVPSFERASTLAHGLDLRGMTGEEALPLVDKFLDDAILAGVHRVDIIHGKGTGALRKKVTEFLSRHPRVRSFHLGEWNEGGTGATVVELMED